MPQTAPATNVRAPMAAMRARRRRRASDRSRHRRRARGGDWAASLGAEARSRARRGGGARGRARRLPAARPASRSRPTRTSPSSTAAYRGKRQPTNVLSFPAGRASDGDARSRIPRRHRARARDASRARRRSRACRSSIICSISSCTGCCIFWATITRPTRRPQAMEALEVRHPRAPRHRRSLCGGRRAALSLTSTDASARSHDQRTIYPRTRAETPPGGDAAQRQRHARPAVGACSAASACARRRLRETLEARPQGRAGGRRRVLDRRARDAAPAAALRRACASRTSWCRAPTSSRSRRASRCRELLRTVQRGGRVAHSALQRDARRSARHDPHQGSVPLAHRARRRARSVNRADRGASPARPPRKPRRRRRRSSSTSAASISRGRSRPPRSAGRCSTCRRRCRRRTC